MHKMKKHLGAALLALGLLVSVALGSRALAVGEGPNTLVTLASASTDESFVADIAQANVVVDVYKLADAVKNSSYATYDYALTDSFASLGTSFSSAQVDGSWETVAEGAAQLIDNAPKVISEAPVGEDIHLDDGIYLVIAHGEGITDGPVAYSDTYRYTFAPSLVALPTNVQEGYEELGYLSSPIDTTGEWRTSVTIALKPRQDPLYGDLVITKNLPTFSGSEPATFVFHVTGEDYDEYASVYATSEGATSTTLVHIPAGLTVSVTEVYDGARYTPEGGATATATIVSTANGQTPASVSFTNVPDGTHTGGGHGIENHFEYVDDVTMWELTSQNGLV